MANWYRKFFGLTYDQLLQKRREYPDPPYQHTVDERDDGKFNLLVERQI